MMRKTLVVTHSGGFHADDIFAAAAVSLFLKGRMKLVRSRSPAEVARGEYVVDVGGVYDEARNRFDHHQIGGAGVRPSGIPYAAFGLVWKKFGAAIAGSPEAARRVEEALVVPIDAHDNGIPLVESGSLGLFPYLVQDVFHALTPTWREDDRPLDLAFSESLRIAERVLLRECVRARDAIEGEEAVRAAYNAASDKRLIVLDRNYEWECLLSAKSEPVFAVEPDRGVRGNWKATAIRTEPHSFENRELFPVAWAGKRDSELASVSGVSDAVFCANQRFIAVARSREGAIALAKRALSQ